MRWVEARALGVKRYNTGKPCKSGHFSDRYTKDAHCIACSLGWISEYRKTDRRKAWEADYKRTPRARSLNVARKAKCVAKPGKAEAYKVAKKKWQADNRWRGRLYRAQRAARVKAATPPWVDQAEIEKIYEQADRISAETSIPHEVDHFYPLVGENSCGLHVPWNLQIITEDENKKKNNKSPEEFYSDRPRLEITVWRWG